MPDESCRKCGGVLTSYSLCQECRKSIQRICTDCNLKTEEQFHESCLHVIYTRNGMKINVVTPHKIDNIKTIKNMLVNKLPLRDALLVFSIIGFFISGFAAGGYLEIFESVGDNAEIINAISLDTQIHRDVPTHILYEDCLGYGNTQSIVVKCPDGKGSVYNAVLNMPYDLDKKFANDVFSIRGISLGKNFDGSLELEYQNDWYHTRFSIQ